MNRKTNPEKYILLTPARNEEKNISKIIESVINQTIKPLQWIIVDDSSTDQTGEIIEYYAKRNNFIKFLSVTGDDQHNFGSKVKALNFIRKKIDIKNYDYIGILDADVSFATDYFEELFNRFQNNSNLGVAGGIIYELHNHKNIKQNISPNSVAGAVQLFRRKCFDEIGDFLPLEYGGEDAAAEITARMHSWEVQTFPELEVLHYGYVGNASGNRFIAKYRRGICFYQLGYQPIFQVIRCLGRIFERPFIIGSFIEIFSFFFCYLRKEKKILPPETIKYLRKEQIQRLKSIIGK